MIWYVAIGGAAGSVSRFLLGAMVQRWSGAPFPIGMLRQRDRLLSVRVPDAVRARDVDVDTSSASRRANASKQFFRSSTR